MYPSEPFPHFVDDYLAYLQEVLPSQASLDGVHLHDDLLEDLSRPAIDAHVHTLSGFGRRLHQIDPTLLPKVEQVEHPIVAANIEARMFELEVSRNWDRNPHIYADALGTSLATQALFAYAPEHVREFLPANSMTDDVRADIEGLREEHALDRKRGLRAEQR